ncbi:MAG: hypothetical protein QXL94_05715 [Candidatus Parvarchaeum sp.]
MAIEKKMERNDELVNRKEEIKQHEEAKLKEKIQEILQEKEKKQKEIKTSQVALAEIQKAELNALDYKASKIKERKEGIQSNLEKITEEKPINKKDKKISRKLEKIDKALFDNLNFESKALSIAKKVISEKGSGSNAAMQELEEGFKGNEKDIYKRAASIIEEAEKEHRKEEKALQAVIEKDAKEIKELNNVLNGLNESVRKISEHPVLYKIRRDDDAQEPTQAVQKSSEQAQQPQSQPSQSQEQKKQ